MPRNRLHIASLRELERLGVSRLAIGGVFGYELIRRGRIISRGRGKNGVTTVGLNDMLDDYFRGTAQISTWYAGLVDNAAFTALAAADTMASHTGWSESTAYSNANRITYSPAAASGGIITNTASVAAFSINATATIKGAFLTSNNTKAGTTGTLFSTGAFDATQAVVNADTLNITYELTLQALA